MEDAFGLVGGSDLKELALVMKADVRGTMEAIRETAEKISTERVQLNVIHSGVGAITESDIMLAIASKARVMGFHVRPEAAARKLAEREGIEIRTFDVVYELLDDVTALMTGLLPPKTNEVVSGHAEVRQLFVIPRRGTVAGCAVVDGVMKRSDQVRVVRNGVPVYAGGMDSLRHVKDDVREVRSPMECGIRVANYNDYKVGDVLEAFHIEETPDTL
jgi:translation initiation factor IF-2